ncbi:MAG: DUF3987 domain-containing protein [Bacteroidales bacterium]|nr:DUF3987 domain-containing protein [Candidatus Liminaster caballi]
MSCNMIQIQGGKKVARPVTSEEEYRQLRGTSAQQANLRSARNGNGQAKMRLVQMNYSGHYPEGVVKGTKLPSKAFGFDIDDKDEFEKVKTLLLGEDKPSELALELGLLMLERSVNQGGHAVFKREMGKTILENQVRIATALKCEMDTNAHDINRVYFSSSNDAEDLLFVSPELFADAYDEASVKAESQLLEDREKYGREELPEGAHKANKHYTPWKGTCLEGTTSEGRAESAKALLPLQGDGNAKNTNTQGVAIGLNATALSERLSYLGIPYDKIIQKWWELYNDGQTPVKSNRDVLTFELAVNLRHIAGFDRETLDKVIPCYDGFPHEQKMKCIDSALNEKRTQMPKRLRDVLTELKKDLLRNSNDNPSTGSGQALDNENILSALEEAEQEDELFYYRRLPHSALPQGIADSIKATGAKMAMPVLAVACPAIGALATDVKVLIHGKETKLNMHAFVVGDAASCKGDLDAVVDAWMVEESERNIFYYQQEEEYRAKKKAAKNAKAQPEEPHLPVRYLTMNNTVANLAERLANTDGKHAFSFTPEADTVAQKWRSSMSDFSTMLRQSYDGSRYDREAKSADATTVHIDHLLWNVCMCGTPDALYRVINNYTDGLLSRLIIAHTPDNTFAPLEDKPNLMTDKLRDRIGQIAHLLPLMQGTLNLPKLEERSRQWVEKVRREALKDDDRVMARARLRDHGTAVRMATCLILCAVAERLISQHGLSGAEKQLKMRPSLTAEMAVKMQTPSMLDAYEVIAESLIDNDMLYFREKLENAMLNVSLSSDRKHGGKNDRIYDRLPETFTFEQAMGAKGNGCTRNSVRQMLKNWKNQGLVRQADGSKWQKCNG